MSAMIPLGITCIVFAVFNTEWQAWSFGVLAAGAALVYVLQGFTFELPRTTLNLTFGDAVVFGAFISGYGHIAIILACFDAIASTLQLKHHGVPVRTYALLFNASMFAIATTFAYLIVSLLGYAPQVGQSAYFGTIFQSVVFFAVFRFALLTFFSSVYLSIKNSSGLLSTIKSVYLSISVTEIAGAGLAAVAFGLYKHGDILTALITIAVMGLIYSNYRQLFRDIDNSILQAERAEEEKAKIAEQKVVEAEQHAEELRQLLTKEEEISSDLRQSKSALEHAAFHDSLTYRLTKSCLSHWSRIELLLNLGTKVSKNYYVLFLDLSRFKNINDSLGHTVGDEVLKILALRLRRYLRDEDTAARLGGDEFAIVLNDFDETDSVYEYARDLHSKLTQPYSIQGHVVHSDVNIGIAPFDSEQIKPEDVLRDADIAMQNAKEANVGIAIFDKTIRREYLERIQLEGDLRYACERGELSLNYQPLIDLKKGELHGFEALLRWHHPELGFVSPAKFIPIAEDSGQIIPITRWILKQTTECIARWQRISPEFEKLLVSVNISGKHLTDEELIDDVADALASSGLRPECLKLEITETTAMENAEITIGILNRLKTLGVLISIDDFGTGYSSLSYLHRLPFDTLKIDRSFVMNVSELSDDLDILETIISLTKTLKKKVIAEGIETIGQQQILCDMGCDFGQGYLFSKPLPVSEMEKELYQKRSWLPENSRILFTSKNSPSVPFEVF